MAAGSSTTQSVLSIDSSMADVANWRCVGTDELSRMLGSSQIQCLVVDSRSFLEYNTSHITESINVSSSKLIKRRLQQDKLSVQELLSTSCRVDIDVNQDIIVYDQCTTDPSQLASDCFLVVFVSKLQSFFKNVFLLKGGFLEFQSTHPSLCKTQLCGTSTDGSFKCPQMTSMSQPCLPVSNVGPTKILPFLFLGSQQDALSQETMQQNGITYILNVSTTSPRPPFISEGHFLRVPVNDSYCDKLLPFFQEAFQFLDKVRESNSCVLVHCLAGISRSPTLAIAYTMRHLGLTTDEAYKYVKDKRPTISPNFNFLGQLLEFEQLLRESKTSPLPSSKKPSTFNLLSPPSPNATSVARRPPSIRANSSGRSLSLHSPTTAFARLNFTTQPSPVVEESSPMSTTPCEDISLCKEAQFMEQEVEDVVGFEKIPSMPLDQLDQLNFKSCFACVDPMVPLAVRGCRSGAKRALADNMISSTTKDSFSTTVILRSHGSQAKRPLVRPSSIAFCSLPASDADDLAENVFDSVGVAGGCLSSTEHSHQRKSRSLEDILNSPDERVATDCAARTADGTGRSSSTWLPSAVEMLGPLTCTETNTALRWWPHGGGMRSESGGSVSSDSRGSLHGSAEVIEVS